jgi:riboflavin kinase/FMN adenylyltransferase
MEIFRDIEDFRRPELKTVVTMGNFDGIHLGHQALVGNAVAEAKQWRTKSVVFTFEPHPLKLLAPERAPQMIVNHQDLVGKRLEIWSCSPGRCRRLDSLGR